jgi:hypothetical protein
MDSMTTGLDLAENDSIEASSACGASTRDAFGVCALALFRGVGCSLDVQRHFLCKIPLLRRGMARGAQQERKDLRYTAPAACTTPPFRRVTESIKLFRQRANEAGCDVVSFRSVALPSI